MNYIFTKKTLSLSLTGKLCFRNCAHCGGHYLKHMRELSQISWEFLRKRGITSLLISGGMDNDYRIPFKEDDLKKLAFFKEKGIKLNFHVGFVSFLDLKKQGILDLADRISFDLHFSKSVLKNVYYVEETISERLKETFIQLVEWDYQKVMPHLCLGLDYGKIEDEFEIIDFLVQFPQLERIIFLTLIPTKNTMMENLEPPLLNEVREVFSCAQDKLSFAKLILGCMRVKKGEYGKQLEELAEEYGFWAIVNPLYKKEGVRIIGEECCVF